MSELTCCDTVGGYGNMGNEGKYKIFGLYFGLGPPSETSGRAGKWRLTLIAMSYETMDPR